MGSMTVLGVNGEMIRSLRKGLDQTMAEFGVTIKRAVDPGAQYPYTRQYVYRLENELDDITPEIAGAINAIASAYDEMPAGVGGTVNALVMVAPGQIPEYTYIPPSARAVPCARPGCPVTFLKDNPGRKYHHPDCKEAHRKQVLMDRIGKLVKDQPGITNRDIASYLHVAIREIEKVRKL